MDQQLQRLAYEYSQARSHSELYQTTVDVIQEELDADFGIIATKQQGSVCALAVEPTDWTDTDELLSPVSLPYIAASKGRSYVIDNASNVRAAASSTGSSDRAVKYRSLVWVPFADAGFLLAGSQEESAFSDQDIERLHRIGLIASVLDQWINKNSPQREESAIAQESAEFLSHDTRNLLTTLHTYLELARESPEKGHFDTIEENLDRLEELIYDTVTFLRTGEHVTATEPLSLSTVASAAWKHIDAAEATLYTHDVEPFLAEESRLYQLLDNVFRNAVEHAGPEVTVWTGALEDGLGFYVEDDGPGIDPDERDSIFELGHSTSATGTGVGLNIVQRIADAHGWNLSVSTGEPGGARFEFRDVEFATE